MNVQQYEKALMEFLLSGKEFFGWFQGKNTKHFGHESHQYLGICLAF